MKPNQWVLVGGLLGALGVAFGAFGAHSAPDWLEALGYDAAESARRLAIYETSALYQMYAAFGLVLVGLGAKVFGGRGWSVAGWMLLAGTGWFCVLLYASAFLGPDWRKLGAIVPIGGATMIAGWVTLAVAGARAVKNRPPENEIPGGR